MSAADISRQVDDFLVASGALLRINDARREHGQIIAFDNRTYDLTRVLPTVVLRSEDYGRISRILADLGLLQTSFARIVLSVALIDDVVLYVLLSIALGLVAPSPSAQLTLPSLLGIRPGTALSDAYYVVVSIAIFGLPLVLGRSFVERLGALRLNFLGRSNALAFQVVFMMVMTSVALVLGISPIFGAFIAGILAGTLSVDAARAQETIQTFSFGFFIPVYFAIVGGAAALETTQIEEIEEVAWEELMPECLWKFRVKDFGPLTVGIDAHGNSLYHDVQAAANEKLKEIFARF